MKIKKLHKYHFPLIILIMFVSQTNCYGKEEKMQRVPPNTMQEIYQQVKTNFKYGIVLKGKKGTSVDCPTIFRHDKKWYMIYVVFDGKGYATALAHSDDLLNWQPLGTILTGTAGAWDANQAGGGIALPNFEWGGNYTLEKYQNKYWLSYLGGAYTGYETEPLSIGLAWSKDPTQPVEWQRISENPILTSSQPDAREFELKTLYKSHIIHDHNQTLGFLFVMFYNAKSRGVWVERIGIAVSNDLIHWQRYLTKPVIDNQSGISGDPQITRIGEVWVMFYFGYKWKPNAFDTFACSYDLENWTKWDGPHLVEPSEPWDAKYAHKPWLIYNNGVVYHFYCAVGNQGRVIALATSKDLK